ncbi:hypothetical protein BsWGS_26643 [Bradybaena similaris]
MFLDLMGCKPTALMNHGEGSVVQRARHVHLQCAHLSTSSSLTDGSCTAENGFKFQISEKALSLNETTTIGTEAVMFAEKLQNCVSTEDILALAESIMAVTPPRVEYFPLLFSKYQEQVYKTLTFSWLLPEHHLKRIQIERNLMVNEIIEPHTRDARFKNLISLTEEHVGDISYSDCLHILQSLHYLFITVTDSSLARKVCDVCNENMDKFDLHQLAILSSCIPPSPDLILFGKITNTAKRWLLTHAPHEVDLGDLCELFSNIKIFASDDMFKLGADTIIRKLKTDQSRITLNMISKLSLFSQLSFNVCESDLIYGLQDIPVEAFDIDISERDLTIEVCSEIEKNLFVCPVLEKVKRICVSEIQKAATLSVYDVMRYSVLLAKVAKPVISSSIDLFVEHVKQSDNVLLLQLMRSHYEIDFRNMPSGMTLLNAYHQRLIRLFTSYSHSDLNQLLWQSYGQFGKYLFLIIIKLKRSGMNLNQNVFSAFNKHFLWDPNDWNASHTKIITCTLYAFGKLKTNVPLAQSVLTSLEKVLPRLDLTYLMYLGKNLDTLLQQRSLSPEIKKQTLDLKRSILRAFECKLSSTSKFAPHLLSNKILPHPRKDPLRKPPGADAYEQLVGSIPRILKDSDNNSSLLLLKMLYFSADVYPVHQKETFETLINVVTSSPKVLVEPGLQLVKVLACSGYQADINGGFTTWAQNLVSEVLRQTYLNSSTLVHLAYHLSLLGIFPDALIVKIFSLDFLCALEQELSESTGQMVADVKNNLALLSRSVAIECPHLAVAWFGRNLVSKDDNLRPSYVVEQLVKSVIRLTGDGSYVAAPARSPYDHDIDAAVFFDPSSGLLKHEDVQARQTLADIEKIALLCPKWLDYCCSSDVLLGQYQADIRQLQILGYTVVMFTEKELSSMDVYTNELLDCFVKTKVNNTSHLQIFKERH